MEYNREPHLLRDAVQLRSNTKKAQEILNDPNFPQLIEIAKHHAKLMQDMKVKGKKIKEEREIAKRKRFRS